MTVAIDIPDDLLQRLHARWGDIPQKALAAVAVGAYREGVFTGAEVQKLLGLASRWEAEDFLKRSMAYLDYGEEDLIRDLETLQRFRAW